MSAFTPSGSKDLLTAYFKPSTPVNMWLTLCTYVPIPQDTGATLLEPKSANGFARVALNLATANWTVDSSGMFVSNTSLISFATPSAAWGRITGWALVDNATIGAGNVKAAGELMPAQWINATDVVQIKAGVLRVMVL